MRASTDPTPGSSWLPGRGSRSRLDLQFHPIHRAVPPVLDLHILGGQIHEHPHHGERKGQGGESLPNPQEPLRMRPVFLHKDERRNEALMFVNMLALLVCSVQEMKCQRSGLRVTGEAVLKGFAYLRCDSPGEGAKDRRDSRAFALFEDMSRTW